MRTTIKDVGFAIFFLLVIAVVAVQAAEDHAAADRQQAGDEAPAGAVEAGKL